MPFVVALVSITGATLRTQGISASTQPKLPAGQCASADRQISGEQLEQMLTAVNRGEKQGKSRTDGECVGEKVVKFGEPGSGGGNGSTMAEEF
jgi:hypothetical protein